jgi:hypothetical protein
MVERVEQLGSELELAILIDINVLRDREIEICQARATQDTDAFIAKRLGSRTRYSRQHRIWIRANHQSSFLTARPGKRFDLDRWLGERLHYEFGAAINLRKDKTFEIAVMRRREDET